MNDNNAEKKIRSFVRKRKSLGFTTVDIIDVQVEFPEITTGQIEKIMPKIGMVKEVKTK